MTIVADKVKFLAALQVDETPIKFGGRIVRYIIIGVFAVLALYFLFILNPVLFLIGVVAMGLVFWKMYTNSRPYRKRSLDTALDVLGETVAEVVFIPPVAMAICDGELKNKDTEFIKRNMSEWGYSAEYMDSFIAEKSGKHYDSLVLQVVDFDRLLKERFRREKGHGRVSAQEVNRKDLCRKSLELCEEMSRRQDVADSRAQSCFAELKARMKM